MEKLQKSMLINFIDELYLKGHMSDEISQLMEQYHTTFLNLIESTKNEEGKTPKEVLELESVVLKLFEVMKWKYFHYGLDANDFLENTKLDYNPLDNVEVA